MPQIVNIIGREILNSDGFPTVEAEVILEDGSKGRASVPSGASTGSYEALELRDNDPKRYLGRGVTMVIHSIQDEIFQTLQGMDAFQQRYIDQTLINLDGTENKSRLGANALLSVSLATAKAAAASLSQPLYRYLGGVNSFSLPTPLMNILNGGVHADNELDIQEFMIIPYHASSFKAALQMGSEIFHSLKALLKEKGFSTCIGSEGGFAPQLRYTHQALDLICTSIQKAGFKEGRDIFLALDVAANELFDKELYHFDGLAMDYDGVVHFYESLIQDYPIISIEDGLAEEDWRGWQHLTEVLSHKIQLVGDDLFVTSQQRLLKGIKEKCANAILIKLNQIGTLTETLDTISCAKHHGYQTIISHRSGETEDTTIADLAVAIQAGQIKTGSLCRTDRVAKYNQLLRIEEELFSQGEFMSQKPYQKWSCF